MSEEACAALRLFAQDSQLVRTYLVEMAHELHLTPNEAMQLDVNGLVRFLDGPQLSPVMATKLFARFAYDENAVRAKGITVPQHALVDAIPHADVELLHCQFDDGSVRLFRRDELQRANK